jgi:serine/threonine protein kinase/Tfp pilus assembly protein PilF
MSQDSRHENTEPFQGTSDPLEIARRHRAEWIDEARVQARVGATPDAPERIGAYRILGKLGEGGMGVVYLAEQEGPIHRRVALKIIKLGMDTRQVIARFETEREALALMNHPNVAKVFDAGVSETGRPYFVMEYVPGIPITEYCDKHRLNTEERLQLIMDVCHAVQHAHQKGIIHRDIKPSNVLLSVGTKAHGHEGTKEKGHGGVSAAVVGVEVKVIDFGVAKATQHRLTERTLFTEQGQLIGTPGYMSPEQAEMTALDIDTRTDIYSLGVMLYELLVGALPFDTKALFQTGLAEIQRIIREVDPPKPSTRLSNLGQDSTTVAQKRRTELRVLTRELRGDLDWITMKAIEKDRTRRYATASEFADDLARHLRHEPVIASPPSTGYRFRKFLRRNKGPVAAVATVIAVLMSGVTTSTVLYYRAETQRARAESERERAVEAEENHAHEREQAEAARDEAETVTKFLTDMLASVRPEEQGKNVSVGQVLDKAAKTVGEKLADKPLVEARLRATIGGSYFGLGFYEEAETQLVDAAAMYRRILGERDPRTLGCLNDLATVMRARGTFSAAEALHRSTLEVQRRVLGEEHPNTLKSMNTLASALARQGKYAEAESLLRQTLDIKVRVLGQEHLSTLKSMNDLAVVHFDLGRYAEAESLLRRALEIQTRVFGEKHPETMRSMCNLAITLARQGGYAEAERLHRGTLDIRCSVLGVEHPDTLESMSALAGALSGQGRYEEAESLCRRTLDTRRLKLGEEHPDTLSSVHSLAIILSGQGKFAEAESLHRRTLDGRRRVLGEEHPDTLKSISPLASSLSDQGKYAEAEDLLRSALEIIQRVFGELHPNTLVAMTHFADALSGRGKFSKAESMYRQTLEIMQRVLGEKHASTLASMNSVVEILKAQGKYAEAEDVRGRLLDIRRQIAEDPRATAYELGEYARLLLTFEPPDLRDAATALHVARRAVEITNGQNFKLLDTLALAYHRTGDVDSAVETQGKALVLLPSEGSPKRAELESKLGEYLTEKGRYADAEDFLLRSYEWMKKRVDESPDRLIDWIARIVKLYDSWDAADPGKGYAEKAAQWRAKLDQEGTKPRSHEETGSDGGSGKTTPAPSDEGKRP